MSQSIMTTETKITKIEDYDNSGQGQTLFGQDNINTLSAAETYKIAELYQLCSHDLTNLQTDVVYSYYQTDNKTKIEPTKGSNLKNIVDIIGTDNFKKSLWKYFLDVKALKKTIVWRDPTTDSTYQKAKAIMQTYDWKVYTYDNMIAWYESDTTKQEAVIQDRQDTYQAMKTYNPTDTQSEEPTTTQSWSAQTSASTTWDIPCVGEDCINTDWTTEAIKIGTNHKYTDWPQTAKIVADDNTYGDEVAEKSENLPSYVTEITTAQDFDNLITQNQNAKIVLYMTKDDCENCKNIATQFPAISSDPNTIYAHINQPKNTYDQAVREKVVETIWWTVWAVQFPFVCTIDNKNTPIYTLYYLSEKDYNSNYVFTNTNNTNDKPKFNDLISSASIA
jgi:hypothetical protein